MFRKILLCALLALPVTGICQKGKGTKKPTAIPVAATASVDYKVPGSPMPPLRIVTTSHKSITEDAVKNKANLVVMMFNPTCEHCEEMTMAMEKNIFLFKNTQIVLVAGAMMMEYLGDFQKRVKADQFPSMKIGVDSTQFIDKAFNYNGLPQVNIYDHDRKLIKSFSGITTIDSIKHYIE